MKRQLDAALDGIDARRPETDFEGARPAFYLEFTSRGSELALGSLDQRTHGIEVLSVSEDERGHQHARILLPEQARAVFARKFEAYATERTGRGRPKNERLAAPIDRIRPLRLRDLWTDDPSCFPQRPNQSIWWEVWLRRLNGDELRLFRLFADRHGLRLTRNDGRQLTLGAQPQRVPVLVFSDRSVVLAFGPRRVMELLIDTFDVVAELRMARECTSTFSEADNVEQRAWLDDILERLEPPPEDAPAVCVLDTGVNRGHPLLTPALAERDTHTCHIADGAADVNGHGTEMAGLALYGDLIQAALALEPLPLAHRLESVKILPDHGENAPHLYGWYTQDAAYRAEIEAPERRRVFSLAITTEDRDDGRPSSWSAAVDLLAAGCAFRTDLLGEHEVDPDFSAEPRLYIVSAGNVAHRPGEPNPRLQYPARNDMTSIQTPSQAWNALTVGACTERIHIEPHHDDLRGWTPIAARGQLSPYSTTSVSWDGEWPMKPDIVMEGGNVARSPGAAETSDGVEDFSLLTTSARLQQRLLTTTWATSAACAQAARLAGRIAAGYPGLRAETIRGLIVHSARWTEPMQARLDPVNKTEKAARIRRFGFGVPDERRALDSLANALTLIIEGEIDAYVVDGSEVRLGDIHLYALPWPREALEALHDVDAALRVTLSYFIEPNPGERGWKGRYRYASHGLRFDLNAPDETAEQFHLRLNRLAHEDRAPETTSDSDRWFIGPTARHRGSLHHDIWTGSASALAAKSTLAVYPVGGWWAASVRARPRIRPVRYSLLVSIETPGVEADLYSAVVAQAGVEVAGRVAARIAT